jgi:hypothetical protein
VLVERSGGDKKSLLAEAMCVDFDGKSLRLLMLTDLASAIATIKCKVEPEDKPFRTVYDCPTFLKLTETFSGEIRIKETSIECNSNIYTLDPMDVNFPEYSRILSGFTAAQKHQYVIHDLPVLSSIAKFTGPLNLNFNFIYAQNGHYVSTDTTKGYIHKISAPNADFPFPIHRRIAALLSNLTDESGEPLQQIAVSAAKAESQTNWTITINNLRILFPAQVVYMHNFFMPQIHEKWNLPTKLLLDKEALQQAVNRFKFLAAKNEYNMIIMKILPERKVIQLESRQYNKSVEHIPYKDILAGDLEGAEDAIFRLNCMTLDLMLGCCESNEIVLYVITSKPASTIRIDDVKEQDKEILFHVVYGDKPN